MKSFLLFFFALYCIGSASCFAQPSDMASDKTMNIDFLYDAAPSDQLVVVSYRVEERIHLKMGTRITTYNVPSLDLVDSYDLGPNNTRKVTPKYGNARVKAVAMVATSLVTGHERPVASADISVPVSIPRKKEAVKTEQASAYIDITDTYERILTKGYKSVDMLKRVANSRFFDGDLTKAAKWYTELFSLTNDLEGAYYYRYAQALKSVSQIDKANEMMALFERKTFSGRP